MGKTPGIDKRRLREKHWDRIRSHVGRKFNGVLITSKNYADYSPEERRFHKKHLKAFLKGYRTFDYGFDKVETRPGFEVKIPRQHRVRFDLVDYFGNPIET